MMCLEVDHRRGRRERKSQERRASPKLVWPPKMPTVPSPWPHQTSFMWTWKMRSAEACG